MRPTRQVCALTLGVMALAAAVPVAAAERLEVSINGHPVRDGVGRIEVTATEHEAPAALVTLARAGTRVRPGDALAVGTAGAAAVTVFKGEVVAIEPVFAGDESRVIIRAFDRLHRLTRGRKTRVYEDRTDSDIVSEIAKEHGLVPVPQVEPELRYEHVFQHNQTDLEFLRTRAARIGYEVFVDDSELRFRRRVPSPALSAGCGSGADARLRAFHPRTSSAQMVTKVTVRGWDPKENEPVSGMATSPLLAGSRRGGAEVDLGEWAMVTTASEAHAIAKAKLEELAMSYITGEAAADGEPRLRPGVAFRVEVPGLSAFAGDLEVVAARHQQSRAGEYVTLLTFRRADRGFYTLPEKEDEVLVAFENGDISRPVVVGSLWDGGAPVPATACSGRR